MSTAKKAIDEINGKKRQPTNQSTNQPGENRANQAGASAANSSRSTVETMGDRLGDNMTDQIVYRAMRRVATNLNEGNFSARVDNYMKSFMEGFDNSLEENYLTIDQELDPQFLLPSSSNSENSHSPSPTTITIELNPEKL